MLLSFLNRLMLLKKVLLVQPPSAAAERVFLNFTKIYCATAVILKIRTFCNAAI